MIAVAPRRLPWRPLLLVVSIALAYHYTLLSLMRGLSLQTPLAYVGLAPLIALLLAWVGMRRVPTAPSSTLALDFALGRALGIGLIVFAIVIALLVPLSVNYWLNRLDILSLPLFVAGSIAVLYGPRRAWALRFPIIFLLLAWPAPYLPLLGEGMALFTDFTIAVVTAITAVLPIAQAGEEGLFALQHAGQPFVLAVGSACAGVNSLVGFLVVGAALLYVVRGSLARKLVWLGAGLVLVWVLNIVRIEAIFVVGTLFGPQAALDVLHPVAGLITFNLGILGILTAAPRIGLSFVVGSPPDKAQAIDHPGGRRQSWLPVIVVAIGALLMATINAGYARFEAVAGGLGQPVPSTFEASSAVPPGWSTALAASYDVGKQFYGDRSSWDRYLYQSPDGTSLDASVPVYVDVITTDDAGALAAYGLETCYRFHGYVIQSRNDIDLGSGVTGQVIDYTNPKRGTDWSAVWWEWPYNADGATRYERMVIFMAGGPTATLVGATDAAPPAQAGQFDQTDDFLATLGRIVVDQRLSDPPLQASAVSS